MKEEDITKVMTIWTKGNFYAHPFIERDYWISNYNKVKEEYLKQAETYIYKSPFYAFFPFKCIICNSTLSTHFLQKKENRKTENSDKGIRFAEVSSIPEETEGLYSRKLPCVKEGEYDIII